MANSPARSALKLPRTLIQRVVDKHCVLFVGSGLSVGAGMLSWRGLLAKVIEKLRDEDQLVGHVREINALLKSGKYLELADCCKERIGDSALHNILRENMRGDECSITPVHQAISRLRFGSIITTNYDKLLEKAYMEQSGGAFPPVFTNLDIKDLPAYVVERRFYILKAHGDIDRSDSIVFASRDYQQIMHRNPALRALLSAIMMTNCILFVGYSLNDPDFKLLLEQQTVTFDGFQPERFALMRNIGKMEAELLKRTAGITAIHYKDHSDLEGFFGTLETEMVTATL